METSPLGWLSLIGTLYLRIMDLDSQISVLSETGRRLSHLRTPGSADVQICTSVGETYGKPFFPWLYFRSPLLLAPNLLIPSFPKKTSPGSEAPSPGAGVSETVFMVNKPT